MLENIHNLAVLQKFNACRREYLHPDNMQMWLFPIETELLYATFVATFAMNINC